MQKSLVLAFGVVFSFCSLAWGQFEYPLAVAVADDGAVFVADRKLPGIWKIVEGKAEVYHQASKKFRTPLNAVRCLAIDNDRHLLAGDSATREVYRFDKSNQPQPLTDGQIGIPMAIAVNTDNELFVADLETQRIWQVPAKGGEPKEFAVMAGVRGLAFDSQGNLIVVRNLDDQVQRINPQGKVETLVKGRPFGFPHHVALGADDELFIADNYRSAIWKVTPGQAPAIFLEGEPLKKPVGIARQKKSLIIADPHAQQVFLLDKQGQANPLVK